MDRIGEKRKPTWETLDENYYALDPQENVYALTLNYAARNPAEFYRD